jgi:hypothetical protein
VQRAAQSKTGISRDYSLAEAPPRRSSSQVKLLTTNNAFCIVQRATAQSKTGFFRDYGVVEAPPDFKPAGLTALGEVHLARRTQSTLTPYQ